MQSNKGDKRVFENIFTFHCRYRGFVTICNFKCAFVRPPHTVVEEPMYNTVRCTQKLKSLSQSLYYVTEVNFVFCRLGNGDPLNNTTARIVFPRSGLVGHRPSTQVKSLLQIATVSKVTCVFVILHVNKQYHT
jgi:hypothetical protein